MAELRLIAEGRASEIRDLGDGRVLRRFKRGGNAEREALVMRHAREHDYPVPDVVEVMADALVLEKVEGPTMLQALVERPASLADYARLLADLHDDLHRIAAPAGLPTLGEGDCLLHLDLHPENVILSRAGPVVIDWTNARGGNGTLDVALTWVICATSDGDELGAAFAERFAACFPREELRRQLPLAVAHRVADPNLAAGDRGRVRAWQSSADRG